MNWGKDLTQFSIFILQLILIILLLVKRKNLGPQIIYFIMAMILTFATEITARFYTFYINDNNHIIYNFGNIFMVFLMLFIYFFKLTTLPLLRKVQFGIIIIFLISYVISSVLSEDFFQRLNMTSYFISIVLLLISIGIYLYEIFNSDKILNLKSHYPFWASIALIFVYFGLLPIMIIGTSDNKELIKGLFTYVVFFINIVGYSVLIAGVFYSSKKKISA